MFVEEISRVSGFVGRCMNSRREYETRTLPHTFRFAPANTLKQRHTRISGDGIIHAYSHLPYQDLTVRTCRVLHLLAYPQQLSLPAAHVLDSLLAAMIGPQAAHHQDRSRGRGEKKLVPIAHLSPTTNLSYFSFLCFDSAFVQIPITSRLLVSSRSQLLR